MKLTLVNPFPLIEVWPDWKNKVQDKMHGEKDMSSHPFFEFSDKQNQVEGLAVDLSSRCREAVAMGLGLNQDFDTQLVATISDHFSDGSLPVSCCVGVENPKAVIKLHCLFKMIIDLVMASAQMQPFVKTPSWWYSSGPADIFGQISASYSRLNHRWKIYFEPHRWETKDLFDLDPGVQNLREQLDMIDAEWKTVRGQLEDISQRLGCPFFLQNLLEEFDGILSFLQTCLSECENRVVVLRKEEEDQAAKKVFLDPGLGIVKTNSMTTAIDMTHISNAARRTRQHNSPPNDLPRERTRKRLQKPRPGYSVSKAQDDKPLAKNIVIAMITLSLPFAVIATFECEAAEEEPQYDSNFHSTLCQMFLGLAGIIAIVAPILTEWQSTMAQRRQGRRYPRSRAADELIPTSNPMLFKALLALSILTLLASAGTYPYSPISSIPLGVAAGITQNWATLLIIEGSGNKIMQQSDEIEGGRMEIGRLESELASYTRA